MIAVKTYPMTVEGFKECAENCDFLDDDLEEILGQAEFAAKQPCAKEFVTYYGQVIAVAAILETGELCFLANTAALKSCLKTFLKVAKAELAQEKLVKFALVKQGSERRRRLVEMVGFTYVGRSEQSGFDHFDFIGAN
jgi:hypothetical protein